MAHITLPESNANLYAEDGKINHFDCLLIVVSFNHHDWQLSTRLTKSILASY